MAAIRIEVTNIPLDIKADQSLTVGTNYWLQHQGGDVIHWCEGTTTPDETTFGYVLIGYGDRLDFKVGSDNVWVWVKTSGSAHVTLDELNR